MAGLTYGLSSPEALQRFMNLVEMLFDTIDVVTEKLLTKLEVKALELQVGTLDYHQMMLGQLFQRGGLGYVCAQNGTRNVEIVCQSCNASTQKVTWLCAVCGSIMIQANAMRPSDRKITGVAEVFVDDNKGWLVPGWLEFRDRSDWITGTISGHVVQDTLTGLVWPINGNLAGERKTWFEAKNWVSTLSYAGFNDWRLPTKGELEEFAKRAGNLPSDFFNSKGFNSVQEDIYWTSNPRYTACGQTHAHFVNMAYGYGAYDSKDVYGFMWPVRNE